MTLKYIPDFISDYTGTLAFLAKIASIDVAIYYHDNHYHTYTLPCSIYFPYDKARYTGKASEAAKSLSLEMY